MAQQRVIVRGWAQESKKSQKVVHYPTEKKRTFQIWGTLQKWKIRCFGIFHFCLYEEPYKSGRYVVVLGPSTFVRSLKFKNEFMSGEVLSNTKANFENFFVIEVQTFMISNRWETWKLQSEYDYNLLNKYLTYHFQRNVNNILEGCDLQALQIVRDYRYVNFDHLQSQVHWCLCTHCSNLTSKVI